VVLTFDFDFKLRNFVLKTSSQGCNSRCDIHTTCSRSSQSHSYHCNFTSNLKISSKSHQNTHSTADLRLSLHRPNIT